MLQLAALLLSVAAVVFLSAAPRWGERVWSAGAVSLSLLACALRWGGLIGSLVQLSLALSVATLLGLILPVRLAYSRPLAFGAAAAGLVALVWGGMS